MNLVIVPLDPAALGLSTERYKAFVLFPDDEGAFGPENVLLPPHLPEIAAGDASPGVNRRLDLCQHDVIPEHADAVWSCEVERIAVRMVGRARSLDSRATSVAVTPRLRARSQAMRSSALATIRLRWSGAGAAHRLSSGCNVT